MIVPGADRFDWSSAGIAVAALVGLLLAVPLRLDPMRGVEAVSPRKE